MTLIATASPARRLDWLAGYAVWIVLALIVPAENNIRGNSWC
jgi:hypothetical protein